MYFEFFPIHILDTSIGLIIGFILGFITYILTEEFRKPNLILEITADSDIVVNSNKYKILNLKLKNVKKTGWKKFFNQTATQIRAIVQILDFDSNKEMIEFIARWNTTREPLTPDYKQVDVGLALTAPREVLSPGEESSMSIVIKKDGKDSCYPFNNESYLHSDFSKPSWEIKDGKFLVSVLVQSAEREKNFSDFLVMNKGGLSRFKISPRG